MKKLIFKKFLKDVTAFFILSTLSIGLIVWVIQAVNFLDFVSEDGHSFKVYFLYTLLNLPKVLSKIIPYLFFISLFYSLNKIENNNELLIFWTNGVSKIQFTNVLIVYSIFYFILQIFLTVLVVPYSNDKARSYIRLSNIDFFPSLIKEKQFVDTVDNLTIFVEKKEKNELTNIYLKDQISDDQSQIIISNKGRIVNSNNKNYLILFDGKIINLKNKNINSFNFKKTEFNLSKFSTKTTTHQKIQEVQTRELIDCATFLLGYHNILPKYKCNIEIRENAIREIFKRIYQPIYIILVSIIASLLIMKSKDLYNYTRYKFILFGLGTAIVILSEMATRYTGVNNLYTFISLSLPIIIFIITYIYMFYKAKI